MLRKWPPWWAWLAVIAWLGYFSLLVYAAFNGPEDPGIESEFAGSRMVVRAVRPGSPAETAGLQPGDRIIAVGGHSILTHFDWIAAVANFESAQPAALEIERAGVRLQVPMQLAPRSWTGRALPSVAVGLVFWGIRLIVLLLGILLIFTRPHDVLARVGALFLGTAGVSSVAALQGMAAIWRQLPGPVGGLLLIPALATLLLPAFFFSFCALFPRSTLRSWSAWLVAWAPAALLLPWFGIFLFRMVYRPESAQIALPEWLLPAYVVVSLMYLAGGIGALAVTRHRTKDVRERRRVELLAAGSLIGWTAALPLIRLTGRGLPQLWRRDSFHRPLRWWLPCCSSASYSSWCTRSSAAACSASA